MTPFATEGRTPIAYVTLTKWLRGAWAVLISALEAVLSRNADLELLVAKLRRGPRTSRSERIDPAQAVPLA